MNAGVFSVVGPGRAGTTLANGLVARGWTISGVAGRDADRTRLAAERLGTDAVDVAVIGRGADLVVISTPDAALTDVAATVAAQLEAGALVIHLSGATDLDVFAPITSTRPDVRVGSLHPLQTMPREVGSQGSGPERLEGVWCAVEGPAVELALALGMHPFVVPEGQRATYHAAASIASNHLVALLGQVERIAQSAGVPFEAFLPLVDATVERVGALGPREALTGPVARGDVSTVAAHLDSIDDSERDAYRALAASAGRLVDRDDAALLEVLAADSTRSPDTPLATTETAVP